MSKKLLLSLCMVPLLSMPVLWAGEKSLYQFSWLDPGKEVYVLQNRKFQKHRKVHANLGYGMTTSGAFVDATNIQARIGYFFHEEWGLEYLYSLNSGDENESAAAVRNTNGVGSIPFRRIVQNYHGAFLLWAPFYGKVNTFNSVVYFDWILGVGYGQLTEKNNKAEIISKIQGSSPDESESHDVIMWETALKFYFNEYIDLRLNLTGIYYQALKAQAIDSQNSQTYYNNYDLTLSLGFNF